MEVDIRPDKTNIFIDPTAVPYSTSVYFNTILDATTTAVFSLGGPERTSLQMHCFTHTLSAQKQTGVPLNLSYLDS